MLTWVAWSGGAWCEQRDLIATDADGDGNSDVLLIDRDAGVLRLLLNDAMGVLTEASPAAALPSADAVGLVELITAGPRRYAAFDRQLNTAIVYEFGSGVINHVDSMETGIIGAVGLDAVNVAGQTAAFSVMASAPSASIQVMTGSGVTIGATGQSLFALPGNGAIQDQADALLNGDGLPELALLFRGAGGENQILIFEERMPASIPDPWNLLATVNPAVMGYRRVVRLRDATDNEELAMWTPMSDLIALVEFDGLLQPNVQEYQLAQPVIDLRGAQLRMVGLEDVAVLYSDGITVETFERTGITLTSLGQQALAGTHPAKQMAWAPFPSEVATLDSLALLGAPDSPAPGDPVPYSLSVFANSGTGTLATEPVSTLELAGLTPSNATENPNVVFLRGGPIQSAADPIVVAGQRVEGYTTGITAPYDGLTVDVSRLQPDAGTGFGPLGDVTVNQMLDPPATDYTVSLNQLDATMSAFYFGDAGPPDPLEVRMTPNGGLFQGAINVKIEAKTGTTILFSVNGGAWKTYNDPFALAADATVQYSGTDGTDTAPTKTAIFMFDVEACKDTDDDKLPDFVEIELEQDPTFPEYDANENGVEDFDEVVRGSDLSSPPVPAPDFFDTDMDMWSDYDETIRSTDMNDAAGKPVAPNLQTVEILRMGTISAMAIGGTAPPGTPDPAPDPGAFELVVLTAAGKPRAPEVEIAGPNFEYRASGDQFHFVKVKALDGTGRVLFALEPPRGLCLDAAAVCPETKSVSAWRTAYRAQYEARIFDSMGGRTIDPRTTAEAMVLNRYYEVKDPNGGPFAPGVTGMEAPEDLVNDLRAQRSEPALYELIQAAVTVEMIDLVSDFYRFRKTPAGRPMAVILADFFAGRMVAPEEIPDGVRQENTPIVAAQTAALINALGDGTVMLSGPVSVSGDGFVLTMGEQNYRLLNLTETIVDGTEMTLRCILDLDHCGFDPEPATVVEIVNRGLVDLPPGEDVDMDGLPDQWEFFFFGDLDEDSQSDPDGDGFSNDAELVGQGNPNFADHPSIKIVLVQYLLGLHDNSLGLDLNKDGVIDAGDLLQEALLNP